MVIYIYLYGMYGISPWKTRHGQTYKIDDISMGLIYDDICITSMYFATLAGIQSGPGQSDVWVCLMVTATWIRRFDKREKNMNLRID